MSNDTVDIQPGVSMLAVLKHLNYQSWYALAEFVDNSVQSYQQNNDVLSDQTEKLIVEIDVDVADPPRISIRDNAAGILLKDFPRAFRPATLPPDRTGLAEFGMGMKSAACWFAPKWTVRTSALGDPVVRTIKFDIVNIVADDIRELDIIEEPSDADSHFTEVILEDVFHVPAGRTVAKIKDHLTDIYRVFVRDGLLELRLKGESLIFQPPVVLHQPYFKTPDSPPQIWQKDIVFDLGPDLKVRGFAAIRETASTRKAGFGLFRRGRVIQGSGDDGYRPPLIFGQSNSYRYQRLFGELHLDGFEVSHTKDGFRWDENEQPFLELLREHLDDDELPLLKQAEGYRVRKAAVELRDDALKAVTGAAEALGEGLPGALAGLVDAEPADTPQQEPPAQEKLASKTISLPFRGQTWEIEIELTNDPSESQWLVLSDTDQSTGETRRIDIRVSMAHPFMVRFAQNDSEDTDGILRLAAGIAVSEVLARSAGVRKAGTVRRNLNDLLMTALSGP
ncbi:ATP-binding protein [Mesorhizobium sp. NBSH29]|uniref:ATP-binding protein n=1 Tax=Mesorhizobium sp. NBSH29 TaxID=2654249 RepID=UPI001896650E|nr:ATP-binding protein [Mesorhizobium sp. NBSH29]QPC86384.1 ATP-binding protein [Mesorhizobium sp. NBSH29]